MQLENAVAAQNYTNSVECLSFNDVTYTSVNHRIARWSHLLIRLTSNSLLLVSPVSVWLLQFCYCLDYWRFESTRLQRSRVLVSSVDRKILPPVASVGMQNVDNEYGVDDVNWWMRRNVVNRKWFGSYRLSMLPGAFCRDVAAHLEVRSSLIPWSILATVHR